jgi:hypothetical protein
MMMTPQKDLNTNLISFCFFQLKSASFYVYLQAVMRSGSSLTLESSPTQDDSQSKKVVFIQPFPEVSKEEFIALINSAKYHKKTKMYYIRCNGFLFTYEPPEEFDIDDLYEKYCKSIKGLHENAAIHQKAICRSYERKNIKVTIESISLPKNEVELDTVKNITSHLTFADQIYINSHGNTQVIGAGCFSMNALQITLTLKKLGLKSHSLPTVSIWACHSGVKEKNKALSQSVMSHLKRLGFKHPVVIGVNGLLFANKHSRRLTYVAKRNKNNNVKPVNSQDALSIFSTPSLKGIQTNIQQKDGIYTQLHKATTYRAETIKNRLKPRNLADELGEASSPSPRSLKPKSCQNVTLFRSPIMNRLRTRNKSKKTICNIR